MKVTAVKAFMTALAVATVGYMIKPKLDGLLENLAGAGCIETSVTDCAARADEMAQSKLGL